MIHIPPGDSRQCRSLTLHNGLRVLLLSDPAADQAGAAMSVGAGSGDEFPGFAGLAHLLEHMLFLGTEKYPAPDDFPRYVQGHGGRYNATTEFDHTRYFFEIPDDWLAGALDRFAQFFIAPCLSESAVVQERDVIEAEYRAQLADDEQRLLGVLKQALNPAHPASRFFCGNRETLGATPEALRSALLDFRERYYTAANLRLIVISRMPLDTLEPLVRRAFDEVSARPLPKPIDFPPLIAAEMLPLWLVIQPAHSCHELRLCFVVPDPRPYEYLQPWEYLKQMLTWQGLGSLHDQLVRREWLTSIEASLLLETRPQALFQIRLNLTSEGSIHIGTITAAVFSYLRRITTEGISAWRHRERQILADQRFRLVGATSTIEFVKSLARQLHRYPVAEALRGPYRLDAFQPQVIANCLAHLTPGNLLALVVDPAAQTDNTSPWFPAPYRISAACRGSGCGEDEVFDFELPPPNPFITAQPPASPETGTASMPRLLHDDEACRIWFQPLAGMPGGRVQLYLNLVAARPLSSLSDRVLTELLIAWLEQELAAELQQARIAGLEVALSHAHTGIMLTASGFPVQLETWLQRLAFGLSEAPIGALRFAQARQVLQARWRERQHDHAFRRLLQMPEARLGGGIDEAEALTELAAVRLEQLQAFRHELLRAMALDGLMAGPLDRTQAQRMAAVLKGCLTFVGERSQVVRHSPMLESLQPGQAYHYRLDTPHSDCAVALYLPALDSSPGQEVRYRLLAMLLHDVFYQRLRVEQQLGYVVMARYLPLQERPGLILLVQSPLLSVIELQQRIRQFLTASSDDSPLALDAERFEQYRAGLLQTLRLQWRQPAHRAETCWSCLVAGDIAFQRPGQLEQAVTDLTLKELQQGFRTALLPSPWVWFHT